MGQEESSEMTELWHKAPWYVKILLSFVIPIILLVLLLNGGWNAAVDFIEGLKRKKVDKRLKEIHNDRDELKKKEDALERERDAEKDKVDQEDGKDLADWFDDRNPQ